MFLENVANVLKKINIKYCDWINVYNIFYKMHDYGLKKWHLCQELMVS